MIRFYTTYYCGWWCRGSTNLQRWQQGWTAYNKTSQESWPVYEMGTYMNGESTEATKTVKSSSCIRIIGYKFQNPGNFTNCKEFVSEDHNTNHLVFLCSVITECSAILRTFPENYFTTSKSSVSQETWTMNMHSLFPSVTNEWLFQGHHLSKTTVWT